MPLRNRLAIVCIGVQILFVACSNTKLPSSLLGTWSEDMVKEGFPAENPKFVKSTGSTSLKFEQQGRKGVILVSLAEDNPFTHERTWSEPYTLSETGNNQWSFKFRGREVSLALDEKNQLQVKGLMMRSYNQALIKRDPEPVESIFVKKS